MATKHRDRKVAVDLGRALIEAFLTNERVNQVLLDVLDPTLWRINPPCSQRRNIATTFAHILWEWQKTVERRGGGGVKRIAWRRHLEFARGGA